MKSGKERSEKLDVLRRSYKRGGVTRREFLQASVALGLTTAGASTFLKTVEAATPKSGGKLRLGVSDPATTDLLDPATYRSTCFASFPLNSKPSCNMRVSC